MPVFLALAIVLGATSIAVQYLFLILPVSFSLFKLQEALWLPLLNDLCDKIA